MAVMHVVGMHLLWEVQRSSSPAPCEAPPTRGSSLLFRLAFPVTATAAGRGTRRSGRGTGTAAGASPSATGRCAGYGIDQAGALCAGSGGALQRYVRAAHGLLARPRTEVATIAGGTARRGRPRVHRGGTAQRPLLVTAWIPARAEEVTRDRRRGLQSPRGRCRGGAFGLAFAQQALDGLFEDIRARVWLSRNSLIRGAQLAQAWLRHFRR
mmetsp:Transcript_138425/g.359737  ORF Transcript_138425/g.359737 Transcript_138425/m.359737 type:complete len:211 (-) Transcript_138425:3037-3669(-)